MKYMKKEQFEKVLDLINGDPAERALAFEMMSNFTLGDIFDLLKRVFIKGFNFTWKHLGIELDARNWFIFRFFNLPEGYHQSTFRWAYWDISTIRWINQNRDRKPDRTVPFVIGHEGYWVSQNEFDVFIKNSNEKGIPR